MLERHIPSNKYIYLLFMRFFAADCQFLTPFGSSACQYFSSVRSGHSFTKTVFVFSFSFRWLIGPFHNK
jgi:hypothetical protein